ncbi:putative sporulation protein [Erysiphe neolycopersici]|uniref:Putative sporulation protein n=1 Tax=Erysiphe neolycopersici TaxID=212602 RepID=A0A420HWW6_9PEZI|nr:putative sporulation protein [Erysiphe neolycopersici]
MSAISRLYESAKSLLLNHPQEQGDIENTSTNNSSHEITRTHQKDLNVNMRGDLESKIVKDDSQQSNLVESSKKRSRFNSQEDNKATIGLSAKKQKSLPLREKNLDLIKTPKTLRLKEKLQKKTKFESTPQDVPISIKKKTNQIEKNEDDSYDQSKIHDSNISTPMNQDGIGNLDTTPFYTAQHYRFRSDDDLEKQLQSSALANVSRKNIFPHESDNESEDDSPETITVQESKHVAEWKIKDIAKAVAAKKSQDQRRKKLKQKLKKRQSNNDGIENDLSNNIELSPIELPVENKQREDDRVTDQQKHILNTYQSSLEKSRLKLSITPNQSLPELLPLEYLEDEDENEITCQQSKNILTKPQPSPKPGKKIRFGEHLEKELKDRRVGNTTYRILKPSSHKLPPKASYNARRTKELWLQGRSGRKLESNRQPFSKTLNIF